MLAIRLQRTGRKGHAQFRIIVQESRRSPSSGNVVMRLGNYDPHTKAITVDKEKSAFYLEHGAQPSPRVAYLLQKEGVKLPSWVTIEKDHKNAIKNTEKLRRNRTEVEPKAEEPKAEEAASEEVAVETEASVEKTTTEEVTTEAEAPAEVVATEVEEVAVTSNEPAAIEEAESVGPETPAAEA